MKHPQRPVDEEQRLEAVRQYSQVAAVTTKVLQDLVALAVTICEAPIGLISFVDDRVQHSKLSIGSVPKETPRDSSFCGHAILQRDLFIVPDAAQDPRFRDNPHVCGEEQIRFYAGAPLVVASDQALGTLCIMDHTPRVLEPRQLQALKLLSRQVVEHLESRNRVRKLVQGEGKLRRAAHTAMRESLGRYRAIVETTPDAIFINRNNVIDYINVSGLKLLRATDVKQVLGRSPLDFFLPERHGEIKARIARLQEKPSSAPWMEQKLVAGDGTVLDVEVSAASLFENDQLVIQVVVRDITGRKQVEERLRESARFAQSTIDSLSAHICVLDESGTILATNQAWRRFSEENAPKLTAALDGQNYLIVCDTVTGTETQEAAAFGAGVREVIRGTRSKFAMEYPCHSPTEHRWFIGRVTRFPGEGPMRVVIAHENITERKQAEAVLNRLAAIVESSDDAIIGKDLEGIITSWNSGAEKIFGYSAHEMVGTSITRLIPTDRQNEETEILEQIRRGNSIAHFETIRETRSQGPINVSITASPIKDKTGLIVGVSKVARDITERKRVEGELRRSEASLKHAQQIARIGNWETDLQTQKLYWSDQIYEMFGLNRKEFAATYESFAALVHPEDRERMEQARRDALAGTSQLDIEHRIVLADGTVKFVHELADLSRDSEGRPTRLRGTVQDITERQRADEHIQRLNRVYSVLSEINQTIVRERDSAAMQSTACRIAVEKGRFRMAWIGRAVDSDRRLEISASYGANAETLEILGKLLGDDLSHTACSFTVAALRTGEPAVCNDIERDPQTLAWRELALERDYRAMASFPLKVDDKVIGTFNLYSSERGFFDGDEIKLLGELADDISFSLQVHQQEIQRKRTEAALRQSDERFRELAEKINEVFWITTPSKSRMLYISPAYEKIWGRTPQSLYDSPGSWLEAIHPDDRDRVREAAISQQSAGTYEEEYRIVRPDGTIRWVHDRAFSIVGKSGEIERIVGVARDETQRKIAEEQFRQSQKMEAIGQLAGGVAHDFNNILAAILMQADLTAMVANPTEEVREGLLQIRAGAERAANLTRQLLLFSRKQVMQPRQLDLNEVVTSLAKMLQRIIGEDVSMQLDLFPRPLITRADAGMVDQVLMNLVVNARDAMPGGGRLIVETAETRITREPNGPTRETKPGRYVCVKVTDTGCGIALEHLSRIFEPFFTTKEPGKGTGLGLATVFGIVKQHGGAVWVDSEVGRGSTFQVLLPATDAADVEETEKKAVAAVRGGTETILLVEDEAEVRMLTRVLLERQGYHVLEAAHGEEAIQTWDDCNGQIHLLLTDIVMPKGVSGRELAARLQERQPRLRVIFTSGYSADIAGSELTLQAGQNFIQKPYTSNELLTTVRKSLDIQ